MGSREPETGAGRRSAADATTMPETLGLRPGGKRGRLQNRRLRLAMALGGGITALLCLGGGGLFVVLYDKATEINRAAPDAVVDSFLAAFLVSEDDGQAALFQCGSGADFSEIKRFREDTAGRERKFSVSIAVTWSSLEVSTNGKTGTVGADLTRTISGQAGRDSTSWQFAVVDEDGWRVCGATEV